MVTFAVNLPDAEEQEGERQGLPQLMGVRERYAIVDGVVLGSGGVAHSFSPVARRELPEAVAKLRKASESDILRFAHVYGSLGYCGLVGDPEKAFHIAADGTRTAGGDPVWWLHGHGHTVSLCLELSDAIQASNGKRAHDLVNSDLLEHGVMQLDELEDGASFLDGARVLSNLRRDVHPRDALKGKGKEGWLDHARALRRHIINGNIQGISRKICLRVDGFERSYFMHIATIEAVYWHLANLVDGGIVKRCEAQGCGAVFIQTHGHQRFCPPRWRQAESNCALRHRQRKRKSR